MNFSLNEHFARYDEDASKYMADVLKLFTDKILSKEAGLTVKSHILTVFLQKHDRQRFRTLINHIDLPELTRACEILDAGRLKRQTKKKLEKYPESNKFKTIIADQDKLLDGLSSINLSLSLKKIKIVKTWVNNLTKEKIEYRAMMFPIDHWKKLADLTHLNPNKDFAKGCEWFLPYCFGSPIPEGNAVYDYNRLTQYNFFELYSKHNFSYEVLRNKLKDIFKTTTSYESTKISNDIKTSIVNKENLTTILWYWDELVNESNVLDVLSRMKNTTENVNLSYGKLVDIIAKTKTPEVFNHLVKLAEEKLSTYNVAKDRLPVAIFGDRSSSMEVAIKTSSIIASLLCFLCNATLHLFDDKDDFILNPPKTIESAIKFANTVETRGYTAPAVSLLPYYDQKTLVNTFIVVTDEEENTSAINPTTNIGYRFAELFAKYIREVNKAKIMFVSFSDPNKDADMVAALKKTLTTGEFDESVRVFKFNVNDPDLNRMDIILKHLSQ
jgi:hypothetical protein